MRHKQRYNSLRLIHVDSDEYERMFYCDEIASNKQVINLVGAPIKDTGRRFITESDIEFQIDDIIMLGEEQLRITELPDVKPIKDNNSRRGIYRKAKVIVTT